MSKNKRWSKAKKITVFGIIGVLLAVLILNIVILPLTAESMRKAKTSVVKENGYINAISDISAHRAGGGEAPEETLSAFKLCMENGEYSVDILEFDLHITKDGELVLLHDDTLDRTSNAEEYFGKSKVDVADVTYAEARELNMGENFVDPNTGDYPYRGLRNGDIPDDVRILSLDGVLNYLERTVRTDGSLNYIIEIKNKGDNGKLATDKLYAAMEKFGITDRTIVGTFHGDVTEYIDTVYYGKITRSAGIAEALGFYASFLYGAKLGEVNYGVLQIPYKFGIWNFGTKAFIDYAHAYGIAVQYWTINEAEDIKTLAQNGADAIMTDYPQVAYTALGRGQK